jgi:response regulator RpfG family c-di-GMP phosphodiesterase
MDEKTTHTVLFVDDEEAILKALYRLFRRQGYVILTAQGGEEALTILRTKEHTVALIVSDQKMPGMNGAAFLEKAREFCPDAMRFLLTGYSEMDAIVAAVNKGEIHRYLTKPWNDDDLILQVKWGLEQYDLIQENKNLLALTRKQNKQLYDFGRTMEAKVEERAKEVTEKNKELEYLNKELEFNLFNTVRAFAALSEMHTPHMKGHGKRVSSLSVEMARKLELTEEEITHIEIAAILHDIGTIGFLNDLLEKHWDNRCSREETALYRTHPVESQNILAFINRLDDVGHLIRHHHERYDGTGYPDQLFENEIPLGSRIIAVADTYDRITVISKNRKGDSQMEKILADLTLSKEYVSRDALVQQAAMVYIKKNVFQEFDPDIVKVFLDVMSEKGINLSRERQMRFSELKSGMMLTRPIYSFKGRFILPHKTELTEHIMGKLQIIVNNNEIPDVFFVLPK